MSGIPTYSFLPWLRTGVANNLTHADGDPSVLVRETLPVGLTLTAVRLDGSTATEVVPRDISLVGPGDIVGIDPRAVIKAEPRNWITNYEPNYLPYVEFYDEDFPWRYVPAAADQTKHRLRPWLTLLVLAEPEFIDGTNVLGKPLPYIELAPGVQADEVLPPAAELWAWAHVHVNTDLSADGDPSMPGVLARLDATLRANPDRGYARVLCPRRLQPDVEYHAFLVPSYETGRLAGLGQDIPDTTVATASAWEANQSQFPYYYRWQFKTGAFGDFEYLVELLEPRPVDKRVGVRDLDVMHPLSNLPPIDLPAELGGVLKLGGALRVPLETLPQPDRDEIEGYDRWDEPYPHPFEIAMARRINLADDYTRNAPEDANPDGDRDPVVTSPLYGRWHALVDRVLAAPDGTRLPNDENWVHRLNLDPRFRVAAGLGTRVVQENDERLMNGAWQQVGDVLEANRLIKQAQLAQAASSSWHRRHVAALESERAFLLTAPVHGRLLASETTVAARVRASLVPATLTSAPFRKLTRPGTALTGRLALPSAAAGEIVSRVNARDLVPAPPKETPDGAVKTKEAAEAIVPRDQPSFVRRLLERAPWLRFAPLVLLVAAAALAFALLTPLIAVVVVVPLAVGLVGLFALLTRWSRANALAGSLVEEQQTPADVDELPQVANFVLSRPDSGFTPQSGQSDSPEAARFKDALRDAYAFTSVQFDQPDREPLALAELAQSTVAAIDPAVTVPRWVQTAIELPGWVADDLAQPFTPVMAYPVFDLPMYKPLAGISSELFLPHINLIPPNSLTLLESNQRFIEAYVVGLNHELARELLWREYPTDQRGSYFRQFWDVSLGLPPSPTPADRERLRDVVELHTWPPPSSLGQHNQREAHGEAALLVLVIRGELLKRYPTAVIYAQKARWHRDEQGQIDVDAERELVELTPTDEETLPPTKVRKPLFEAKVDPDIYFLGFDLEAAEAKGGTTADDDPGWFFVIKERPGEPRFGLDEADDDGLPRLITWSDLAWRHIETAPSELVHLDTTIQLDPYIASVDQENEPDPDDAQAGWSPGTNAAELAYILYRVPALVAVHASRMLP